MFETIDKGGGKGLLRSFLSFLMSLAIHTIVIFAFVVLPLVYFRILPDFDLLTFVLAAPTTPAPREAPPPHPPRHGARIQSIGIAIDPNKAPTHIPRGLPEPSPEDLDVDVPYPAGVSGTGDGSIGVQTGVPGPGILTGVIQPPAPLPPPPAVRRRPLRMGGDVLQGMVVRRVDPQYPPLARIARVSGQVVLQVHIDEEGNVDSVDIVSGNQLLIDAAVAAVRQWKYSPTLLNGEPVPVVGTITVVFNLK